MTTERINPPLRMPVVFFLRLLAIAYGQNEPPRGERVRIDLTRPPTNADDFHWLAEQVDRIAGELDAGKLDERTWRWLVEFFGRRHIPARDPEQEGFSLSDRDAREVPSPLDALVAAETVTDLLAILSPREQQMLRQVEGGVPAAEAAEAIAPTPAAARQLLSRLRKKIRRHL